MNIADGISGTREVGDVYPFQSKYVDLGKPRGLYESLTRHVSLAYRRTILSFKKLLSKEISPIDLTFTVLPQRYKCSEGERERGERSSVGLS